MKQHTMITILIRDEPKFCQKLFLILGEETAVIMNLYLKLKKACHRQNQGLS